MSHKLEAEALLHHYAATERNGSSFCLFIYLFISMYDVLIWSPPLMLPGAILSRCSAAASRSPLPLIHALEFSFKFTCSPNQFKSPWCYTVITYVVGLMSCHDLIICRKTKWLLMIKMLQTSKTTVTLLKDLYYFLNYFYFWMNVLPAAPEISAKSLQKLCPVFSAGPWRQQPTAFHQNRFQRSA